MRGFLTFMLTFALTGTALMAAGEKAKTAQDMDAAMKKVGKTQQDLNKAINAMAYADAKKSVEILKTTLTDAENFWAVNKKADAQQFSKDVLAKLDVLEKTLSDKAPDQAKATAAYRAALREDPSAAHAWWGLANLKTVRFEAADADALASHFRDNRTADRPALGFALAKALEDQDRYAEALDVLHEANALRRRQQPWNASAFSREVDEIEAAFASLPASTGDATFGREAIFIASLPRSGSTLAEQIVATHPEVEGAGEITDLAAVIAEESARTALAWPAWAQRSDAATWHRLGARYLERTARFRTERPQFTDKALSNWLNLGAAAAMLPGARFVHCRRDPVETALSCYRQWFNRGQAWTYALDDIVAYWRDHERLMRVWKERLPGRVFTLDHEALLTEPEATVRALLDFFGLPFDARCLEFHRNERSVRTASAAQVREPLARRTDRASHYGALLDPLRRAIADA